MPYVPVSEKDPVELNTVHRSWFVLRGGAFVLDRVKQMANATINLVNKSQTIRVVTVRWYTPDEVAAGACGFPIPATVFVGQIRPWALRVDWKKIAESANDVQESSVGDIRSLIAVGFFLIVGLLVALKFTEKSVTNTIQAAADAARKTFPWALAGLAGIMLIVFRRRLA